VDAVLDVVNGKDTVARSAGVIRPGGSLLSTLRAADAKWLKTRRIAAHNISARVKPKAAHGTRESGIERGA
jgi:hypothetical protein